MISHDYLKNLFTTKHTKIKKGFELIRNNPAGFFEFF